MPNNKPKSIVNTFLEKVNQQANKVLIYFEDKQYSYKDIYESVVFIAGGLKTIGVQKGDRVALYLENSPSFIASYLAVQWIGGIVVLVNTRYKRLELKHILTDSGAKVLISDLERSEEAENIILEIDELKELIILEHDLGHDTEVFETIEQAKAIIEPIDLNLDDIAVIGYTSGTTGKSKGAMLSNGNFLSNSIALTKAWHWTKDDVLLLVLPLFHMHGLAVGFHGTLVQGSSIVLKRRFIAEDVYKELSQGKISMFFGVPTMHKRLLELAQISEQKPQGLRLMVSGSAPLSPQIHAEVEKEFGLKILERYGMTETIMNTGNPYLGERKAGTVGVPFEGVELRIADGNNKQLATNETGEIQLRGPNICQGYWQRPEASKETWTSDKWFKTGDLGFIDSDGYLTINGRAKELIISGGFNVYPRELEELIAQLDGVEEVAVVGLADDDLGEKISAVIVGNATKEEILQHCANNLAGFKKPREIFYLESLPRNALGKVQKHILIKQIS